MRSAFLAITSAARLYNPLDCLQYNNNKFPNVSGGEQPFCTHVIVMVERVRKRDLINRKGTS